jgi:nitric oxide reductase activation protein
MMSSRREKLTAAQLEMDRQIIRVDIPPAHAGITAALRRAFEAAAAEPCDRDFAELLRRLN